MATHLKRNGSGDLDFHWGYIEKVLAGVAIILLSSSIISQIRLHIRMAVLEQRMFSVEQLMAAPRPTAPPGLDTHKVVL